MSYYRGTSDALLDMVERGCARLMRSGGGPIAAEKTYNLMSADTRATVIRVARERKAAGHVNCAQLGREVGHSQSCVRSLCIREGILP